MTTCAHRYMDYYTCRYAVAKSNLAKAVSTCVKFFRQREHVRDFTGGSWLHFPTATQIPLDTNHVPRMGTLVEMVEGHVPQGVEVQVLSSAHRQSHSSSIQKTMCQYTGRIGTWFDLCTERSIDAWVQK